MKEDFSLGTYIKQRENNFNFIRLFAACLVIYGHSSALVQVGDSDFVTKYLGWGFTGGIAVDVFFVISGFLITASVMRGNIIHYVVSRVLRIYPALIFWVFVSAFILAPMIANSDYSFSSSINYFISNASAYKVNFFIPGVFSENKDSAINGVLWSVTIEIRLYLIVLLLYLFGFFKSKSFFNLLFFTSLVLFYFNPELTPIGNSSTDRHVSLLFMIGSFYWVNRNDITLNPFFALILLGFLTVAHRVGEFEAAYIFTLPYFVFMIAFMPGVGWFRKLGDYSYGVYLVGWPVQQTILLIKPNMTLLENQIYAIIISIILAVFSWHLLEKPMLKLKVLFSEPLFNYKVALVSIRERFKSIRY